MKLGFWKHRKLELDCFESVLKQDLLDIIILKKSEWMVMEHDS